MHDTVATAVASQPAKQHSWTPALAMMCVSILSYVDRNTLALLAPTILAETHISRAQYGLAVSAYSIAFLLSNPIWGRLLDRIGLRRGMSMAAAAWTLASVSHIAAISPIGLFAARAALGLGEGAAAPGGLRTVTQTLPAASRSRGIALTYSGGSAGAILTPLLMTQLAERFGFRAAFLLTGLLGAAWIAVWLPLSKRHQLGRPRASAVPSHERPWPRLRDPRLLGTLLCYALGALPLGVVVYCAPLYLHDALGLAQVRVGGLVWIAPFGSELGIFLWGILADRRARGRSKLRAIRELLPLAAVLSLPLALVPHAQGAATVLGLFFLAMFVASAFQLLAISYGTEVFALDRAGYLGGLASGGYGAALALLMPLLGALFDRHAYALAFGLAAAAPVLGYVCFLALCTRGDGPAKL